MDKPHTEFPVFIVMRNGFIMPPGLHMHRANAEATAAREEGEVVPLYPPKPPAEWMADLKKLAKDIDDWGDTHLDGPELEVAIKCHAMVLALIKKHYSAPAGDKT